MPNVRRILDERVTAALRAAFPDAPDAPAIVTPSQEERFGDYQANGAMGLAKRLKRKPRDVAEAVLARLDVSDLAEKPEIAGPGFINLRLKADWVAGQLGAANQVRSERSEDDRLGVPRAERPETVVVDYSAPNLAKEMHVGHLRSTIIGDALVRMLEFAGHKVVRQNHVGDWGRQFGMVILGMWHLCMAEKRAQPRYLADRWEELQAFSSKNSATERRAALEPIRSIHQRDLDEDPDGKKYFDPWVDELGHTRNPDLQMLERGYKFVTRVETLSEGTELTITHNRIGEGAVITPLSEISKRITAMLQEGGEKNKQEWKAWNYARKRTIGDCQRIYDRLGVRLTPDDVRGESAYDPDLPGVVEGLQGKGLLQESAGARCVFLKGPGGEPLFNAKDGSHLPLIVQKSDEGGYLYATTDLAAIRYRADTLHADRVLYVVDARQSLHFQMLFECAYQAGFAERGKHHLEHVAFGTMMGPDGRPFKTREGGTVKLMDLLDEAEKRALDLVTQKNPDLSEDERKRIAQIVGIGAVKYADLSQNRTSDYVFSWEKMLALDGNTAPYMQYACARVRSIFRKGGHDEKALRGDAAPVPLAAPQEVALGKAVLRFAEAVERALEDYRPNVLAAYLYDLAQAFTAFYDACPVLPSPEPVRTHRLKLCDLVARVIERGLGLLGIETAERM